MDYRISLFGEPGHIAKEFLLHGCMTHEQIRMHAYVFVRELGTKLNQYNNIGTVTPWSWDDNDPSTLPETGSLPAKSFTICLPDFAFGELSARLWINGFLNGWQFFRVFLKPS
jgi:hypothetical protein